MSEQLLALAQRIAAQAGPGEQLEAYVARGASTSVKAYGGEVESFTSAESMGVGIRVIVDGRQGFAHAGTFDEAVLADTLADARDNARYSEPDPCAGLAVPDGVASPVLDLWRDEVAAFPTQHKIDLAIELERRVRNADPRITGVRVASFADSSGERAIASSTGIAVTDRGTYCSVSVTALAADGGNTAMGAGFDLSREPHALDLDRAAHDAVLRATRLLGATKPPSGKVTVVLEPRLAATLVGILGGMLSGDVVVKGRSPFADRLGDTIASPLLTLVDDATDARSLGADEFDGEGLATRRVPLVVDGVLQHFLYDSYTARRAGTVSTASARRGSRSTPSPGPGALALAPGITPAATLLEGVEHGLFVQSFSGLHSGVNAVSGDFSVGVEGLMVRNGALAEPVREATLASTLQRLLTSIVAVGSDLEWLPGGSCAATLVLDDVTLSGA